MDDVLAELQSVNLKKARILLDTSEWTIRKLIDQGELESFIDGRSRKVTLRSIKARLDRLLATETASPTIPPPGRGRPRKAAAAPEPAQSAP